MAKTQALLNGKNMLLENNGDHISEQMRQAYREADVLDCALTLLLGHDAIFHPNNSVQRPRKIALARFEVTRQSLLRLADTPASQQDFAAIDRNRINPAILGIFTDAFGQSIEMVITSDGCSLEINRHGISNDDITQRRDSNFINNHIYTPRWVQKVRAANWRPNRHFKNRQRRYYRNLEKQHSGN